MPISILHVFSSLDRGGAEMRTVELLRSADRQQYQHHFLALSGRPGALDEEIRVAGGGVHLLPRGRLKFARCFREFLERHRFQVVSSRLLYFSGFVLRQAAQSHVPVRIAVFQNTHDGRGTGPARQLYRRLMRQWLDRYATHVVGVSEGALTAIWGRAWKTDPRCQVVYNGIDVSRHRESVDPQCVRREFGLSPDARLCVHIGRMVPQKNHLRLLSIFAAVHERQPAARLLLVGAGHREAERHLRARSKELGVEDRVIFGGVRCDVPQLLEAADVMIFPSQWEGLPGVVIEACASGTPVVASDLPGTREIAARLPGVRLLSLADADAVWAETVGAVLANPVRLHVRERMRRCVSNSVFTVDKSLEQLCRIWQGAPGSTAMSKAA